MKKIWLLSIIFGQQNDDNKTCSPYVWQRQTSRRKHAVNFGSEMVKAKHVSGKNIFCSMNKEKIREKRIFEIVHCPFEGRAKLHHLCQPNGPVGLCQLAGNSKGQYMTSKILFPLHLYTFIEQNIFFPEACFAYTISKPNSQCDSCKILFSLKKYLVSVVRN